MKERKEKVKKEIKYVAKRIEVTLSDYRTKYYKEIPLDSRKMILENLKGADIETGILLFETEIQKYMYFSELIESNKNAKIKLTNIYNYLDNVVNEVLKFYNREFVDLVSDVINSQAVKLIKSGYKINNEFNYLANRLEILNFISLHEEKYPVLVEIQDIISIVRNIKSISPGCLVPEIHELYGVKSLLLELEEVIKVIETIEDSACINVILEYIDSMIDWNWFKEIR